VVLENKMNGKSTAVTSNAMTMSQAKNFAGQSRINISEINDKVRTIVNKYSPDKIVLFGSYAKGNSGINSDVDLLVIMDTKQSTWDLAVEISLAVKHTFPMDIIVRTPQEIARRLQYGDVFITSIMENGKILYERAG
jgi:predicted nucleotidyltransferase